MRSFNRKFSPLLALAGLLALTACSTLSYRALQTDFNAAVQLDNTGQPFTDAHGQVVDTLTPAYIAKLNPKLRPNAWTLRAISSWRSGQLSNAVESARLGLKEPTLQANSRDAVILKMVPGLVIDSELLMKWHGATNELTEAQYKQFARDFITALRQFREAQTAIGPPTPDSVVAYFHFQKWRVLEDWRYVMSWVGEQSVGEAARREAKSFLGKEIDQATDAERDAIPAGHPLRQYIRAKGGN